MQPRPIRPAAEPERTIDVLPPGMPACTSTGRPFRVATPVARGTALAEFSAPDDEIRCTPKEWVG